MMMTMMSVSLLEETGVPGENLPTYDKQLMKLSRQQRPAPVPNSGRSGVTPGDLRRSKSIVDAILPSQVHCQK